MVSAAPRSRSWKEAERAIARAFGVNRNVEKGLAVPDVDIPGFSVESKKTKKIPSAVLSALDQAARNARGGRAPLAVMFQPRQSGVPTRRIVLMEFSDFLDLHKRAYGSAAPVIDETTGD